MSSNVESLDEYRDRKHVEWIDSLIADQEAAKQRRALDTGAVLEMARAGRTGILRAVRP